MISDETIIDEPMRQPYPSIPQAWGIFGMVLAGQIVASPLILVFGKTGLGIFLMYTVALSLGLLYAVIQKTKTLEQSNEWQPIFQNRSVPAAIYPLCIFFVPIMAMISAPIAQLIPTPEMFKEQLDFPFCFHAHKPSSVSTYLPAGHRNWMDILPHSIDLAMYMDSFCE